ncbi:MAG: hypothetical protein DWP98_07035 [Bacteroidetes bacterium]|nr:MAG: hypothetical protein DWP98_07035 [Bacteroidota bacterium]MBL1143628.1 hypothetical protein [Bacteroidota bacterium]MCB0803660.1 hypothetical protein [Flavobacteriales bacterium]NOG56430.1 hypothetical protein [Bacteroidota bacterium]
MEKRISQEKRPEGLLIKIKAYKDDSKQSILTIWMVAWTLCGLAIISQIFYEQDEKMKTMILVFASFWGYFEYIVVKAFRWRRKGEEQILISEDKIHIGRTISNRGFLKPYRKDLMNKVRLIEKEENSFIKLFGDSYWVIGGQTLALPVNGKVLYFGLRLSDKEANHLMKIINKELPD